MLTFSHMVHVFHKSWRWDSAPYHPQGSRLTEVDCVGCQGHYNSSKRRRESHTLTLQLLSANDMCHFCLTGLAKASHMV